MSKQSKEEREELYNIAVKEMETIVDILDKDAEDKETFTLAISNMVIIGLHEGMKFDKIKKQLETFKRQVRLTDIEFDEITLKSKQEYYGEV